MIKIVQIQCDIYILRMEYYSTFLNDWWVGDDIGIALFFRQLKKE